ncbi:MAG: ABC transporter permease subunit [Myxococcota bacterium]
MTVRDLGYQPYEGKRLPASNNTWVMLRHGLGRAWASWMVKTAVFLGWAPFVVGCGIWAAQWWILQQFAAQGGGAIQAEGAQQAGPFLHSMYNWYVWIFGLMITLGAGAGAISEDLTHRAFQFYFSKPMTVPQYLLGRILAVSLWMFFITFIPGLMMVVAVTGMSPEEARLENFGLILPAFIHSVLIAAVTGVASVGVSSLSKSRALTMSTWVLVFIVPYVLATIVTEVGEWPWLKLLSLPALLAVVGDALFKVPREDALEWFHALPILVAVVVGGMYASILRLRRAEVVA